MYDKLYYTDSFFQMFVQPQFTYNEFLRHRLKTLKIYNQFINKEIDKYPYGFWNDVIGLINVRIILDYLIHKNKITLKDILDSNKQILVNYKIRYNFSNMTNKEIVETLYPDDFYREELLKPKTQKELKPVIVNNIKDKKEKNEIINMKKQKLQDKDVEYEISIEFEGKSRRKVYYYRNGKEKMINIHAGYGETYTQISFYDDEVDKLIEILCQLPTTYRSEVCKL